MAKKCLQPDFTRALPVSSSLQPKSLSPRAAALFPPIHVYPNTDSNFARWNIHIYGYGSSQIDRHHVVSHSSFTASAKVC